MAAVKETLVFVALFCYIFLVDFGSGRSTKGKIYTCENMFVYLIYGICFRW